MSEFAIIDRFFRDIGPQAGSAGIALGVGDDCALLTIPAGRQLAMSVDTLVAGRHFPDDAPAAELAWRALAVATSDLAAMGATPLAATLALTLPTADSEWLQGFSRGLHAALEAFDMALVGGDTTRGPLSLTVQVQGLVPQGQALLRSGARPGEHVFVSGCLGDARAALSLLRGELKPDGEQAAYLQQRFYRPAPRLSLGEALIGLASSAIDLSDGLVADLGHIAERSGIGARLYLDRLPLSEVLQQQVPRAQALRWAATGGDDYELCFTVPPSNVAKLPALAQQCDIRLTCIGEMVAGSGVRVLDAAGTAVDFSHSGYQHFSGQPGEDPANG